MSYALVQDIPASWERYSVFVRALGHAPRGLLLHVAGPTDEGFRIIEIWQSEAAWRRFATDLAAALASVDPDLGPQPIVRELRGEHLVVGEAWPDRVANQEMAVGPGPE